MRHIATGGCPKQCESSRVGSLRTPAHQAGARDSSTCFRVGASTTWQTVLTSAFIVLTSAIIHTTKHLCVQDIKQIVVSQVGELVQPGVGIELASLTVVRHAVVTMSRYVHLALPTVQRVFP